MHHNNFTVNQSRTAIGFDFQLSLLLFQLIHKNNLIFWFPDGFSFSGDCIST